VAARGPVAPASSGAGLWQGDAVRSGVWLFPAVSAPQLVAAAVQAEASGLDEFWLGDEGPAREPWAVLAAAAAATRRITLAVGITNPYVRHPALTATTALTVAELAGGASRVILGLGAGGTLSLDPFGLRPTRPLAAVRRALATIRAVSAGEAGVGYEPVEHAVHGHLAVYVGARGERLNRLASAEADGALVAGIPPFHYEQVLRWVRSVRQIEVALYPSVAFDPDEVERSRPQMLWAVANAPGAVRRALGVADAELADATTALTAGDEEPARRLMTDDRLVQVLLTGSPEQVGRRLAELARRHRPSALGLALLQENLPVAIDAAAAALAVMRRELGLGASDEDGGGRRDGPR
jgi:5,10-methylenetetrahydromethanopterin reductase